MSLSIGLNNGFKGNETSYNRNHESQGGACYKEIDEKRDILGKEIKQISIKDNLIVK